MTREEAIKEWIIPAIKNTWNEKKNAEILKALEQEHCRDAVSRQAVLDINESHHGQMPNHINHQIWQEIKQLPSVSTEKAKIDWDHGEIKELTNNYHPAILNNYLEEDLCIKNLPSASTEKTGRCKDCKWWKDSDGIYRRGGHAESKCPINRREVLEGNGYCYMFEPQESEVRNAT